MKVVQIGSNKGNDDLSNHLLRNFETLEFGLFVEANPFHHNDLKTCYSKYNNAIVEILAIKTPLQKETQLELFYHTNEYPNFQITTSNLDHLLLHMAECPHLQGGEVKSFVVDCITLEELLDKYQIKYLDWILLDVEGMDAEILLTFNWKKYNIFRIEFEHIHLGHYKDAIENMFLGMGYEKVDSLHEYDWAFENKSITKPENKLNNLSLIDSKKENSHLNILFFGRNSSQELAEYDFILNDILPEKTKKNSYFLSLDEIRNIDQKFDVFVYSCRDPNNYPWGYMPTYADTLECVLKTEPKIIIQLSDEFYFEDLQLHNNLGNYCNLLLRQHNHVNYTYTENTLHIPLGYTNDCEVFSSPKKYDWSFIGEVKSNREEMINTFSRMPNHFVSTNIGRKEMCEIYSQSTFVLCGRGNTSLNCFRQYEASMNGAIPVVVGSEEELDWTFKYEQNPPWIFASNWESAFEICSDLLKNPEYLEEWKTKLLSWWSDRLSYIQSKVNLIIENSENKLINLPPVHYISVDYCTERREKLHQKFSEFGIKNITGHIFEKYDDTQHEIITEYIDRLSIGSRGPVTSHLKAIKQWYNNTTEEVAFFCEDDLSMELVQYWNFTWDEFYNSLPEDWEIVQLAWLREEEFDRFKIGFRNRCWCDWSGCAYIIKREFAKKLIDNYYYDGRFHLDVKGSDIQFREDWAKVPVIETIIFSPLGRVYGAPLFTEDLSFMPSYVDPNTEEGKKQPVNSYHHESYKFNLNWWKTIGCNQTIEEFMKE